MKNFSDYFDEWEVKPEYDKEFISLWSGWLEEENCYKLDEVTEKEWNKFNELIRLISTKYKILLADFDNKILKSINNIEDVLDDYEQSMNKPSNEFFRYIIPELNCVIEEHWDYTYIVWYKEKDVVKILENFIYEVGLYHFSCKV